MTGLHKRTTIILATLALFAAMADVAEAAKKSKSSAPRQAQASAQSHGGGYAGNGGDKTLVEQIGCW